MKLDKKFRPIQLIWHVDDVCNASCKYCFAKSKYSKSLISNKSWNTVVRRINDQKSVKRVSLIGGEPLLVKELDSIVRNLRNDITINIDSNLTLIKKRWSDEFAKKNIIFSTTLDSIDENINFKTRGHSAQKTIGGIKFLLKKKKNIQVIIVVSKQNVETLEKTAKFLLDLGIYRLGISRVRMSGRAWLCGYNYFYEDLEKIKKKTRSIVKKLLTQNGKKRILVYNIWHDKQFFDMGYEYEPSCKCALFRGAIDWEGYFYPCELMPFYWQSFANTYHFKRPDLRKTSISRAFNSKLFKFFRERMLLYPVGCEKCKYSRICNHGCRFYAFLTSTILTAKDVACGVDSIYDVIGYHYYSPLSTAGRKRWNGKVAKFIKKINRQLGKQIVELGCGGGVWTFFLENLDKKIIGIDNNHTMILIAEEYKKIYRKKSQFILGNFLKESLPKAESYLLLDNGISHLNKSEMTTLLKKLQKKTQLFLIEINRNKLKNKKYNYYFEPFEINESVKKKNNYYEREFSNKNTGAKIRILSYNWSINQLKDELKKFGSIIIDKNINDSEIILLRFKPPK